MRALQVAEKRVGMANLVKVLRATEDTIRGWRDGLASMPQRKFLVLVDLLTELDLEWTQTGI
jgi:hypothetical protein